MNAYYLKEDKSAVLGTIKAQLPFSEVKYRLLNCEIKFLHLSIIFCHMNFKGFAQYRCDCIILSLFSDHGASDENRGGFLPNSDPIEVLRGLRSGKTFAQFKVFENNCNSQIVLQ